MTKEDMQPNQALQHLINTSHTRTQFGSKSMLSADICQEEELASKTAVFLLLFFFKQLFDVSSFQGLKYILFLQESSGILHYSQSVPA